MLSNQFFYHAQNILLMICQPMPECFWNHFRQSINHVPGARSREIVNILRGNFTSFDLELWGIGSWPATDPVCILENAPYAFYKWPNHCCIPCFCWKDAILRYYRIQHPFGILPFYCLGL